MPRVVPSQVVTFIDTLWPTTDQQKNINALQAGRLSGLVELADEVPGRVPAAVAALVGNKTFGKQPPSDPEEWVLHHYVEVATHLAIIKPDTATEARLAKDFRNLIHPGRAQRLAQKCDRGTALSSVAALELVVRDLS
ncbi:MAG: hypothetical protein DMG36_17890 [Acidobacteria bacterium]|nr:MAG: hypothetical protein DMG36_17890 [Acidobacteriota bacterium]